MSSSGLRIPELTRAQQSRAADPERSVWVSANAGSGKTYVLARRVIRLLLGGADPSRILCLTYTRSAAANMALRVFGELASWSTLADAELRDRIAALEGEQPSQERLRSARRLFARALETPGGLKIQTIHAFCEAVLHRFPLEANIAGHFELIDEQVQAALLANARREVLAAASGAELEVARAWRMVIDLAGEAGFDELLQEIVAQRNLLEPVLAQIRREGSAEGALRRILGIGGEETAAAVLAAAWPDSYFTQALATAMEAAALAAGKKLAAEFAAGLAGAIAERDPRQQFEMLCGLFLTLKDKAWAPRSASRIASRGVAEHFPGLEEEFQRCASALQAARDRLALLEMVEATAAALVLAERLIASYERQKRARGYLDFADLIVRTVALLSMPEAGSWVQYKLDQGLDHILIDEAQDTSPEQWQVIRKLAEEFFAGEGARGRTRRTLFAVGDEKQSIYSFQGAEPAAFAETGMEFARRIGENGEIFERVHLRHSFRSVSDVLSAVDRVFAHDRARRGLTLYPEEIHHPAIRANEPGHVEIWPRFAAERNVEPEDWTQSVDHASLPAVRLAEAVALRVSAWLAAGEILPGRKRRLRPGDIMVLVRKRDSFVHALSRSLKARGIAVAGADRLRLSDHIAVKDLIALGRFVLQPEDDLSLAALLRSPLFDLSDDELFQIAHDRGSRSLWRSLLHAATMDERFRQAAERLSRWRSQAGYSTVHAFYATILGRDGARAAFLARLGRETAEILDEFVNFIFACERGGPLGLGTFLETLEHAAPEIKREIAQARDEVRIMTVHAAKGLEAPVVFLIDNGSRPFAATHLPRLLPVRAGNGRACFLWRADKSLRNRLSLQFEQEYCQRQEDEYRRLLYVGMTRAEDRLILCGYHGLRPPEAGTWHDLVQEALSEAPESVVRRDGVLDLDILLYSVNAQTSPQVTEEPLPPAPKPAPMMPQGLGPLPPGPELPRPLTPSRAGAESVFETDTAGRSPVLDATSAPSLTVARGAAVHRLLQFLPRIAPDRREEMARAYLERIGAGWPDGMQDEVRQAVAAILADPRLVSMFGEASRAEVAIAGYLKVAGELRSISGRVDRMSITPDRILFVDYKTGRNPPARAEDIPAAHLAQLALYGALLRQIHPGRKLRASLLYTEGPLLHEISEERIDAALEMLAVS